MASKAALLKKEEFFFSFLCNEECLGLKVDNNCISKSCFCCSSLALQTICLHKIQLWFYEILKTEKAKLTQLSNLHLAVENKKA